MRLSESGESRVRGYLYVFELIAAIVPGAEGLRPTPCARSSRTSAKPSRRPATYPTSSLRWNVS